jgi:hypothetical protein
MKEGPVEPTPPIVNDCEVVAGDPAETLHPTALRIRRAAKRLLVAKGFGALARGHRRQGRRQQDIRTLLRRQQVEPHPGHLRRDRP